MGPVEILVAMGFKVFFPENHAAMIGAKKLGTKFISLATQKGYSPDICSYLTSDLGSLLAQDSPLKEKYGLLPPRPDVLVFNNQQCMEVGFWFKEMGRQFNAPVFGISTPLLIEEVDGATVRFIEGKYEELIKQLETMPGGRRFDIDRLREVVSRSAEAVGLWQEVLGLAKNVPSPLTFFDATVHMAPIVVLRGTEEAVDYYRTLRDELKLKAANGDAAVPGERKRVYWDGMPIWFALRSLSEKFFDLKIAVVASTYCNTWAFEGLDAREPLKSLARAQTFIFLNRGDDYKEKTLRWLFAEFKVDGFVCHTSKTCRRTSNALFGMKERLEKSAGIPGLLIEADVNDERLYSSEQTMIKLEAFAEMME